MYKHGVYVMEQDTSLVAPIEGTAGLQVIFGTAPINMVKNPENAVNTPLICYSFAEAVASVGYSDDFKKYTLCQSIDASFRVFNVAPIILVNVLDVKNPKHIRAVDEEFYSIVKGQVTLQDRVMSYAVTKDTTYKSEKFYYVLDEENTYTRLEDVTVGDSVSGTVYESIAVSTSGAFGVLPDTVVVKSADGKITYAENIDYITDFDSDGFLVVTALSTGSIDQKQSLRIAYTMLNPDGVTAADIIGGVDVNTGKAKGIECISQIFPRFGMTPGQILAPGFAHDANVIAALEAKTSNINGCFRCECLVDIPSDSKGAEAAPQTSAVKYADVKTAKENLGIDSAHTIACWPWATVGSKVYAMSALIAALNAYNDALNDDVPYIYPSNKSLGITGICLADGTPVVIDQEQANLVNSYGVVTAINYNGYKCWGNNTAVYPSSTDPKDRFIAIRRMFSWWANTLILTYHQKVDDPANRRLVESIIDSENIRGNSFVARGICAEARVEFLDEENPVTDLIAGKVTFHVHFTPFPPAEDIEFILEFNPYALSDALNGGDS